MKKLNLFGKLAISAVVIVALLGAYFLAGSLSKGGAENTITGFATAISNKEYDTAFEMLASQIKTNGSKSAFATRLGERFSNSSLELKELALNGKTGYAIFFVKEKSEYLTIPLIKENGEWMINYFTSEAKCVNKCTAGIYCKDDKTFAECKDADGDGCTEEITKACEFSCSDDKCSLKQENFVLNIGQVILAFSPIKIMLIDTDANKNEATLEVGNDVFVFAKGESRTAKGLSITVAEVGKDKISLKVKEAA